MKKLISIFCTVLIIISFSSCKSNGISNRAIVKAILVDVQEEKYKVSLVMLNCEPSSQIAEIKEMATINTGVSDSLNTAMLNAEKAQSKAAFYAQNELLLININAVKKFDEIVNYFLSENCSRPGMTVFLTETKEDDLKQGEKNLPKLVNQIQSINVMNNPFVETRIYDVALQNNSYSAMLPILKIDINNGSYIVENMGLVTNNGISSTLQDNALAISIMMSKHSDMLSISTDEFNFKASSVKLSNEMQDGKLISIITGNIKQVDIIGDNKAPQEIEAEINRYLSMQCNDIFNKHLKENNILKLNWWLKMYGANENCEIEFVSKLSI